LFYRNIIYAETEGVDAFLGLKRTRLNRTRPNFDKLFKESAENEFKDQGKKTVSIDQISIGSVLIGKLNAALPNNNIILSTSNGFIFQKSECSSAELQQ
jgi:hypothetical protein